MRAAVFAEVGRVAVEERPAPAREEPTDVVLDIEACGICGTDLQILGVPPGHPATVGVVLGHEFVGVVAEAAEGVGSPRPGDRVVVAPNVSCGRCAWCRRGLSNHCESFATYGITRDGGLAPRARVRASACHPIAAHVPAHLAALAEPLSTVVHGAQVAGVFPGETVCVIGAGPVGLMFTALLTLGGASVVVVEPAPRRAGLAAELGAVRVVDPVREEPRSILLELTDGLGADAVIDAVGSELPTAIELARKGGRIVVFGLNERARPEIASAKITRNELTVVGSFVGQYVFPPAIRLLEQGRLDLDPLVTHRIRVDDLSGALEDLRGGRAVKVEVEFP
ncbi:MAG: alcohol dehydrogenase catalytic domain-containing protein [Actinomycetota bacterium]|nr:alcohol dehydrogenase catalytic domain-containing protein [Actinomycetota bacterium]